MKIWVSFYRVVSTDPLMKGPYKYTFKLIEKRQRARFSVKIILSLTLIMLRFFSVLSLLFGNGIAQINPIRDPSLTIAPTVAPVFTIGPIAPIRTVPTIRTISSNVVVISRTTGTTSATPVTSSVTSASEENTNKPNISESGDNLTLVYALVPTGILALMLILLFIRRKRGINNKNVVNIDLNIENVIPTTDNTNNTIVKQSSVNSARFSNHIYEEVDYESRYEMPSITGTADYENVFNGDNEYGKQVTTIV